MRVSQTVCVQLTSRLIGAARLSSVGFSQSAAASLRRPMTPAGTSTSKRFYSSETTVNLPALAESLTEGEIGEIHIAVGDQVKVDQLLFSIETDKATAPVNSPQAGTVLEILVETNDVVEVGAPLLKLGPAQEGKVESKSEEKEKEKPKAKSAPPPPSAAKKSSAAPPSQPPKKAEAPKKDTSSPAPAAAATPMSGDRTERRERLSKMRRVIAQRLKDSQNTYAMLTTFQECDMSALFSLRKKYGEEFQKRHQGTKLGFMSAFVKAAASALEEFPQVNAVMDGDDIVFRNYVDVSIAVASPKGLVVPVIRDANRMSFAGIENDISRLGALARDNEIAIEDMAGGTFTISNGGVFGSLMGTPIINPPQSAILGMHGINQRPVVVDGKIEIRPMMYLALTYDHRIIDGREGVLFLRRIKHLVEDPARMVVDV